MPHSNCHRYIQKMSRKTPQMQHTNTYKNTRMRITFCDVIFLFIVIRAEVFPFARLRDQAVGSEMIK